ncbi:MAG: hypothetical protein IJA85_07050 [Clostridia bacterium]|nr:hypothetical protein [Clostridia bacterium]
MVHPANKGLNFTFDGSVSREVLCNYLSRMLNHTFLSEDRSHLEADIQLIKNVGAKYIGRACTPWIMSGADLEYIPRYKDAIDEIHAYDSEIVLEACIFETAFDGIEEIPIPAWVFEAFNLPVEKHNFNKAAMLFPDGWKDKLWGEHGGVPDTTQLETQMWFYYRACLFIDMGFEAIHMGQVMLMGYRDTDYAASTKLYNMIRSYAKKHARRHFVFLNAHAYTIVGTDGKLLQDFHLYPLWGGYVPEGEIDHVPMEGNPQRMLFDDSDPNGIYHKNAGGMTHSGWYCDSLPYAVEMDNYCGHHPDRVNTACKWWGYDQISWFANQPHAYKKEWLSYAWYRLRDLSGGIGYFEMPANRTAAIYDPSTGKITQGFFHANSREYDPTGTDTEQLIAQIWIDSAQ